MPIFRNLCACPVECVAYSSGSDSDFNPQNTQCIPAVKIFAFLDFDQNWMFWNQINRKDWEICLNIFSVFFFRFLRIYRVSHDALMFHIRIWDSLDHLPRMLCSESACGFASRSCNFSISSGKITGFPLSRELHGDTIARHSRESGNPDGLLKQITTPIYLGVTSILYPSFHSRVYQRCFRSPVPNRHCS